MNNINWLLKRAKTILQSEGFIPLVRRGFSFVTRRLFWYENYYLYVIDIQRRLKETSEVDFLPRVEDFTLKIICTNREADELEAEGFEFRSQVINARHRLDNRAIAFCAFVGQELANIVWVAMTQEAKDALDELPFRVDFSNNEYCHSDNWTNPKYRGRGLAPYVVLKAEQFAVERGKVVNRSVARTNNVPSNRAFAKLGPNIPGQARYLKILWWKYWKEKPLT